MAEPIVKFAQLRLTEAGYQLSEEQLHALRVKGRQSFEKVGGKRLVACRSRWASVEWGGFGLQEFPNIEALQEHMVDLEELQWFRYFEVRSILGTHWQP